MNKLFLTNVFILVLVAISLIVSSCGGNGSYSNNNEDNSFSYVPPKTWNTVEEVKRNIEGTVWTYTEPGKFWRKIEFKNGKCNYYTAKPSTGNWGDPEIYDYLVSERRYEDTGKKYINIAINIFGDGIRGTLQECLVKPDDGHYNFSPSTKMFKEWFETDAQGIIMEQKDYEWD
ncbi:MAG: hypothetical protein IKK36_13140 [Bacteroidales bacterium]|nr:hypothetical protein [Bacteroidales bacterium]